MVGGGRDGNVGVVAVSVYFSERKGGGWLISCFALQWVGRYDTSSVRYYDNALLYFMIYLATQGFHSCNSPYFACNFFRRNCNLI